MTQKINVDIETLHPYQKDMLAMTYKYQGKGVLMTTGRGVGKSVFARLFDDIMKQPVSELVLAEDRLHGARYYTVHPVGGSWFEMERWSINTFGPTSVNPIWVSAADTRPAPRWFMNDRRFWFRNKKDRDWFILRWNS